MVERLREDTAAAHRIEHIIPQKGWSNIESRQEAQ